MSLLDREKLDSLEDFLRENFPTPEAAVLHMSFEMCWLARYAIEEIDEFSEEDLATVRISVFSRLIANLTVIWARMGTSDIPPDMDEFLDILREGGIVDIKDEDDD